MTVIEVFADVSCPFAHVGLRRLVARRDALGADLVLRVRAWPLELVNGHPMDAAFIAEEVEEIRAQVAPDLFAGFVESAFPRTSMPAFALAAAAYGAGDHVGERVSLALRDALFEHGQDVSDPSVIEAIGHAHRVVLHPAAFAGAAVSRAVQSDWHEGQQRGVQGSPHFFTPDGAFFCPTLDIRRVDGRLRITADNDAFDAFVDQCLRTDRATPHE
jgi:predicted DsbA family dithiol-disulfide isomerase